MNTTARRLAAFVLLGVSLVSAPSEGQIVVQEDFNTGTVTNGWTATGGACLTAATYGSNGASSVPGCVGLPYYGGNSMVGNLPDSSGNGALRMTDGWPNGYNQAGAIISNFTFPNDSGLQVTFRTISYAGDSGGAGGDGADGLSFFLMDGSYPPYDVGAYGGSLGYTCSNANDDTSHPRYADASRRGSDGLAGAYLGLGIDEYGNFLNPGDNTASGPGYQPNRIGLRGAGNITWAQLNRLYPNYYPASLYNAKNSSGRWYSDLAVQATCQTGYVIDFSDTNNFSNPGAHKVQALRDYNAIPNAYSILPTGLKIANESATTRTAATPITYKLKITSNGLLSLAYSVNGGAYQSVLNAQSITASNGALPSTFRFGFAGSTGGSTNVHEILCFQAAPADTASSSAGLNQVQSAKLQTGAQVYFAYYNPTTWAGYLTASNIYIDPSTQLVTIASNANWDASCTLTGLASGQICNNTNASGPQAATAPSARTILTWNDASNSGVPFEWSSLSNAEQTALDAGDGSQTANRLQFLRGDRSNELTPLNMGLYRVRASVLGDIVNSSPTWVGPPTAPYNQSWTDKLNPSATAPEASGTTYATFQSSYKTRQNVVYVGANDGFMHGFRAGGFDSSNNFVANSNTPNDGVEILAYMPQQVLHNIHNNSNAALDFSNPQYGHAFDVDATPGTGELYYSGTWHTWLAGGLGAGGAGIYALDVTNPSAFQESAAASLVVGDWTASTINCANVSNCGQNLGNTYGTPAIRRFHNGQWGMVFGNGFNSATGNAGIYIMLQPQNGGTPTFYYLQVPSSGANGIAYASPVDLDGDHIVDYIYAGDLQGNVWRFDVTSAQPSSWTAAASPLFTTPTGQPITTKVLVASVPGTNHTVPRLMVAFGTGQQTAFSNTSPTVYSTGTQYLYGIWDWNMSAWNALQSTQYASLQGPQTVTVSQLQAQSITGTYPPASGDSVAQGYRTISNFAVCWSGSSGCTRASAQFGWSLPLPGTNEQIVYSPTLINGSFVVNTTIPPVVSTTTCQPSTPTGWTMSISVVNGGTQTVTVTTGDDQSGSARAGFLNNQGQPLTVNGARVIGEQLNGTGSVSLVNSSTLLTQGADSVPKVAPYNPGSNFQGARLTWTKKR